MIVNVKQDACSGLPLTKQRFPFRCSCPVQIFDEVHYVNDTERGVVW